MNATSSQITNCECETKREEDERMNIIARIKSKTHVPPLHLIYIRHTMCSLLSFRTPFVPLEANDNSIAGNISFS